MGEPVPVDEQQLKPIPVAIYDVVLLMAGVAYYILSHVLIAADGPDSKLAAAFGSDYKGKISVLLYAVAIVLACVPAFPNWPSVAIYVVVAVIWLIPDRRLEKKINHEPNTPTH